MTPSQRQRLAIPVVAVYWLLILGGLVTYTATRSSDPSVLVPLWIGAVAGTLLGQLLALYDFRLWITALIVLVAAYFTMPIMAAGFADGSLWKVFIPAALCGFWCLSDRAMLAAFWFPVVLWMLSILDRTDGSLAPDGSGVVLLGGLGVLFLVFLHARESRRVGLWCAVSAAPLARAKPPALLKEPPGRPLARAGWGVLVSAITVAITAWVAPQLWRIEPLRGDQIQIADPTPIEGLPCCPLMRNAETDRSRVKEYLDLGLGHDDGAIPSDERSSCRACDDAVATGTGFGLAESGGAGGPGAATVGDDDGYTGASGYGTIAPPGTVVRVPAPEPVAPVPTTATEPVPVLPDQATSPVTPPIEAAPAPAPTPPPPPPPLRAAPPDASRLAEHSPGWASAPRAPQRTAAPSILPWLVALATAALVFQLVGLALRPVRRIITLRHLRRPFWDETIDQRVSNSWQLALVGLRDAGWRPGSGEAPRELAARVGIEGVERCATILERARHGVGIDVEDVSDMQTAADAAYRSARGRLGAFARAIAWLRWPLT
jgi:hypothetical protein